MDKLDQFISLFVDVWKNGISGINISEIITALLIFLIFLFLRGLFSKFIIRRLENYVSKTSMEVGVKIESENPLTGEVRHTASAHLTFVALNKDNKPTSVDPIVPESDDEVRRYDRGKERYLLRKQKLKESIK